MQTVIKSSSFQRLQAGRLYSPQCVSFMHNPCNCVRGVLTADICQKNKKDATLILRTLNIFSMVSTSVKRRHLPPWDEVLAPYNFRAGDGRNFKD
jgi:hypothetical protein